MVRARRVRTAGSPDDASALDWTDRCLPIAERLGDSRADRPGDRAAAASRLASTGPAARGPRPAARRAPAGARERPPRRRAQAAGPAHVLRAVGRSGGGPRARPRGARDRAAARVAGYGFQMVGNAVDLRAPGRRVGLGGRAARRVAGDRRDGGRRVRVLHRSGGAPVAPRRGRLRPTSTRRREILRDAAMSPTRSSSRTRTGPGPGPRSPPAGSPRPATARSGLRRRATSAPLAHPLGIRAALHAGDAAGAARLLAALDGLRVPWLRARRRPACGRVRVSTRSRVVAPAALAGYREALRCTASSASRSTRPLAAVDMAALLRPPERDQPDVVAAIERPATRSDASRHTRSSSASIEWKPPPRPADPGRSARLPRPPPRTSRASSPQRLDQLRRLA